MAPKSPEQIWGNKLETVDRYGDEYDIFNLRLKPSATDKEKRDFEDYVMNESGGAYYLAKDHPKMTDPYYTWEGKVVERASLAGRSIPTV